MRRREEDYMTGNLVAMIDVVFQIIIFFVCTSHMQDTTLDERIRLAMAPNGEAVENRNPYDITIDVDATGNISIARMRLTEGLLYTWLRQASIETGQTVPVVIRGDAKAKHAAIKTVMDACAKAGIWKIKFVALKEKG